MREDLEAGGAERGAERLRGVLERRAEQPQLRAARDAEVRVVVPGDRAKVPRTTSVPAELGTSYRASWKRNDPKSRPTDPCSSSQMWQH